MNVESWDKIATNYFEEVGSPFSKGVQNPLIEDLVHMKGAGTKSIIDIGCGIGNLIPHIKHFKHIHCVDFSEGMIEEARKRHKFRNVTFECTDARSLKQHHARFDVAVAVNSFIAPDLASLQDFFDETARVLVPGGQFLGVFPSMESVIHLFTVVFERELKRTGDEAAAYEKAWRTAQLDSYDLPTGLLWEDGFQKHYYQAGIERRLQKAGFADITFDKVTYPWRLSIVEDARPYAHEPQPWDWYAKAKK